MWSAYIYPEAALKGCATKPASPQPPAPDSRRSLTGGGVQIHHAAAVAEALHGAAERAQHRQHRVRHRRTVGRFQVHVALDRAAAVPGDEERTPLVVV